MPNQEPLSAEEIAEMKRLEEAASPGPWDRIAKMAGFTAVGGNALIARVFSVAFKDLAAEKANAEFISVARSFIPRAIATIEGLQADNNDLSDTIGDLNGETWKLQADRDRLQEQIIKEGSWQEWEAEIRRLQGITDACVAERDQLRAELEQLRESFREKEPCGHTKNFLIGDNWGHFACTVCEVERLKADERRMDWLINTGYQHNDEFHMYVPRRDGGCYDEWGTPRTAIDAAIQKEKEKEKK